MVITANQNMQPPQAPSTPVVTRQALSELVNYYRELAQYHRSSVDYHRQLLEQHILDAEVAEKQLTSIEAILHPLTIESVNQKINSNAKSKQVNGTGIITPSEDKSKGVIVEPEPKKQVKNGKTKSISSKAEKTKKPTKKKNTGKTKKSTKAFSSRLPYSEKLAANETIVDAVALCLQEYYPQVISAEDLVKYYYPEGLEGETKKRANGAFSNCLSKGAGKRGWIKASIGKYRWKDEG